MRQHLTISIADIQANWVREEAKHKRTTISAVVSALIKAEMRARLSNEMLEGLMEEAELRHASSQSR